MSGGPQRPAPGEGDARDLRAAEYVLGTLPADERAAFERELAQDAATGSAMRAWERRLAPLSLAIPEENPPAGLWDRIVERLPRVSAANDDRVVALTRQVRRWRIATVGAGLAAGLALAVALQPKPEAPASAQYVAVVSSGGALPALIVEVDTAAGTARVRPVKAETPSGRSLELWYVGADKTPKPLGLIGAKADRVALPDGARSGEGVFAVSVEPPGGSPTGQPTGQVIYTGTLIRE